MSLPHPSTPPHLQLTGSARITSVLALLKCALVWFRCFQVQPREPACRGYDLNILEASPAQQPACRPFQRLNSFTPKSQAVSQNREKRIHACYFNMRGNFYTLRYVHNTVSETLHSHLFPVTGPGSALRIIVISGGPGRRGLPLIIRVPRPNARPGLGQAAAVRGPGPLGPAHWPAGGP